MFEDWFYNIFAKEVELYIKNKNLDFKILLLIDNAPCLPKNLSHPNIKVEFLPPNTTSLLQPLDQGIISTFKAYYIKNSLQFILKSMEDKPNLTLPGLWKEFSILDCINITSKSINELKSSTLKGCWKKLWPEVADIDNDVNHLSRGVSEILDVVESTELFENIEENDILDMINDAAELTEDDLIAMAEKSDDSEDDECNNIRDINSSKITELLMKAHDLIKFAADNDPLTNRANTFECSIIKSLAPYEELKKKNKKERKNKNVLRNTSISMRILIFNHFLSLIMVLLIILIFKQ